MNFRTNTISVFAAILAVIFAVSLANAGRIEPLAMRFPKGWLEAANGDNKALFNIAQAAENGNAGADSAAIASALYSIGANRGHAASKDAKQRMDKSLSQDQRNDSKEAEKEFLNLFAAGKGLGPLAALMEPFISRYPKRWSLARASQGGDGTASFKLGQDIENSKDGNKSSRAIVSGVLYGIASLQGNGPAGSAFKRVTASLNSSETSELLKRGQKTVDLYGYREEFGVE